MDGIVALVHEFLGSFRVNPVEFPGRIVVWRAATVPHRPTICTTEPKAMQVEMALSYIVDPDQSGCMSLIVDLFHNWPTLLARATQEMHLRRITGLTPAAGELLSVNWIQSQLRLVEPSAPASLDLRASLGGFTTNPFLTPETMGHSLSILRLLEDVPAVPAEPVPPQAAAKRKSRKQTAAPAASSRHVKLGRFWKHKESIKDWHHRRQNATNALYAAHIRENHFDSMLSGTWGQGFQIRRPGAPKAKASKRSGRGQGQGR